MWVSGHTFGVKYAHTLVIFFKAGDVIKLAILSILLCSLKSSFQQTGSFYFIFKCAFLGKGIITHFTNWIYILGLRHDCVIAQFILIKFLIS